MHTVGTALVAGIAVVAALSLTPAAPAASALPTAQDPGTHTLLTPEAAGGLSRDQAGEQQYSSDIDNFRQAIEKAKVATNIVSAFYQDPSQTATGSKPPGILFVGFTTDANGLDPANALTQFKQGFNATTSTDVDPGAGGGRGTCVQSADNSVSCAWSTTDSVGVIVPTYQTTMQETYKTMLRMRPDLETSSPGQPSQPSQPGY